MQIELNFKTKLTEFDGSDYVSLLDKKRLVTQLMEIFNLIKNGKWYTLFEIEQITKYPQSSISAQLRNLRKRKFGSFIIEKKRRGEKSNGLFEYRLINN